MVYLRELTLEHAEQIRQWRNRDLSGLRTSYFLTKEMQEEWYRGVISNRNSTSRFYSIVLEFGRGSDIQLVGYVGLENIHWQNKNAEISLLIDPKVQGTGIGKEAIEKILDIGFKQINLNCIYGECYINNPAKEFWRKLTKEYGGDETILPERKYWSGEYYDSLYFSITRKQYENRGIYTSKRR